MDKIGYKHTDPSAAAGNVATGTKAEYLKGLINDSENPLTTDQFLGALVAQRQGDIVSSGGQDLSESLVNMVTKAANGGTDVSDDGQHYPSVDFLTNRGGIRDFVKDHMGEIRVSAMPYKFTEMGGGVRLMNRGQLEGFLLASRPDGIPSQREGGRSYNPDEVAVSIQHFIDGINNMDDDRRQYFVSMNATMGIPGVPSSTGGAVFDSSGNGR